MFGEGFGRGLEGLGASWGVFGASFFDAFIWNGLWEDPGASGVRFWMDFEGLGRGPGRVLDANLSVLEGMERLRATLGECTPILGCIGQIRNPRIRPRWVNAPNFGGCIGRMHPNIGI